MQQTEIGGLAVIAVALSLNNLGAALALGALGFAERRWQIAMTFGVFEFLVPLAGMGLGRSAAAFVADYAEPIGIAVVAAFGIWTLVKGARGGLADGRVARRGATWWGLALLAGGLSVDNLVIGFGLGLRGVPPLLAATLIAITVFGFILVGLRLGTAARFHWERRTEIGAGFMLVLIAVAMALGWI